MAEPADTADASEVAPPKSKKKLIVILGALVVLLGGGGAGAWYFMQHGESETAEAEAEPAAAPVFLPLDTFTVNLQDGEQYLQIDITLQLTDPAVVEAIKLHMPRVRSRLLSLLSSKHADELATTEDKKALAQEILAQVRQPFAPKGKAQQIDDVLFTSFVIQ
jgi:flagellar FliL protein